MPRTPLRSGLSLHLKGLKKFQKIKIKLSFILPTHFLGGKPNLHFFQARMLFQTLATRNKDEFVFPGEVSWLKALTLLQQMRQVVEIDVLSVNTATHSDSFFWGGIW